MAGEYSLFIKCGACFSTGTVKVPDGAGTKDAACPNCLGSGYINWGYIEDINDTLADIVNKLNDIKEVLDAM